MLKDCQIFTPNNYVNTLLNEISYYENLYGKKVLENSCGDGNVLSIIVERYINDALRLNISTDLILKGLAKDIVGFEIDKKHYQSCINNLNNILKKYNMSPIKWSIYNKNYLTANYTQKFDFIIGNPPYIEYKKIPSVERDYLKQNFTSCEKGKFDYCYAFIEKSINDLKNGGEMSYLIPSSIFKTVFGQSLRNIISPYICKIIDYNTNQIFEEALVKSAIIILKKAENKNTYEYFDESKNELYNLSRESLNNKWIFTNEIHFGDHRFGDYYKVSHVVATLLNKAFVIRLNNLTDTADNYYHINDMKIEKSLLKDTATPRTKQHNIEEKIIFPYKYENNKLVKYTDEQFKKSFPLGYKYLITFKSLLDKRKKDKNSKWFEYGRSQALTKISQEKLLMSTVITDEVKVYPLSADCIPYGGIYIIPNSDNANYTLERAQEILTSADFFNYINEIGIHINGNSLRISSKDIENYYF